MRSLLLLLLACPVTWCYPPPHPAVVAVRHEEERLPPHQRSPALHNPHLRNILPLTSLLHKGEMLVFQREADDVTRREIYNILTHAGLIPRNPRYHPGAAHHSGAPRHHPHNDHNINFFDIPFIGNPELLQHL